MTKRTMSTTAGCLVAAVLTACASQDPGWQPTMLPDLRARGEVEPVVAPTRIETARNTWRFEGDDGARVHTEHYCISSTVLSPRVLDHLPLFLERALTRYRTALTPDQPLPAPVEPMHMFLFATRDQWVIKTRELLPHQADAFKDLGRGGYTTRGRAVLYYIGYRDTMAIAAHEGWHQYTQCTLRDPLPVWLEEGIATYMEGHRGADGLVEFLAWRNWERWSALRDVVRRNRLIPLERLLEETPQSFLLDSKDALLAYYAQVWCLTRFLIEGEQGKYADALAQVMTDAAAGTLRETAANAPRTLSRGGRSAAARGMTGPWVALAYLNGDLAELEREYVAYARDLVSGRLYR